MIKPPKKKKKKKDSLFKTNHIILHYHGGLPFYATALNSVGSYDDKQNSWDGLYQDIKSHIQALPTLSLIQYYYYYYGYS